MDRKCPACVVWIEASHRSDSSPISSASGSGTCWPLRISAWQIRALSYVTLVSNHGQSSVAQAFHSPTSFPVSKILISLIAGLSGKWRKYSWMPSRLKVHARGE